MLPSSEEIKSIYHGIEVQCLPPDYQGWNYDTAMIGDIIREVRPGVIVEVGVWKGASLVRMGKLCKELGLHTVIYAVDAWCGSAATSFGAVPITQVPPHWSAPSLYQLFLSNMKHAGLDDSVVPVWSLTDIGAIILKGWGVRADAIYVDAAHDYESALADMHAYWPILKQGGVMFGDDYLFPGVMAAVERFAKDIEHSFQVVGGQWKMEAKR